LTKIKITYIIKIGFLARFDLKTKEFEMDLLVNLAWVFSGGLVTSFLQLWLDKKRYERRQAIAIRAAQGRLSCARQYLDRISSGKNAIKELFSFSNDMTEIYAWQDMPVQISCFAYEIRNEAQDAILWLLENRILLGKRISLEQIPSLCRSFERMEKLVQEYSIKFDLKKKTV
jgi:hypothetical protein